MKFGFCVACLETEDLQHHHVVPRNQGGSNKPTNLITLCQACHLKVHQGIRRGDYNAGLLSRQGQERARAAGRPPGRRCKLDDVKRNVARRLLADPAIPVSVLAHHLGVSRATFYAAFPGGRYSSHRREE